MSDLRDKNIISEYLVYADENYNKLRGNANFYEASESLRIHCDDKWFLIVDSWDFIRELNEWLNDNYAKELCDETRYELPEDISDREYFTTWLDYLTDGMWGFSDEYSVCEHCNKAFRTSPDSYSWVANYWIGDGFIICEDCVKEDYAEEYLESLQNNPHTANTILSDVEMENAGYEKAYLIKLHNKDVRQMIENADNKQFEGLRDFMNEHPDNKDAVIVMNGNIEDIVRQIA